MSTRQFIAVLLLGIVRCGGNDVVAPEQTHAIALAIRPGVTVTIGGKPRALGARHRLAEEDGVVTDGSGRAAVHLDSGAFLVLGTTSELTVHAEGAHLSKGRVWIDAPEGTLARLETPSGVITARAAGVGITVTGQRTTLYVARGEALYATGSERGLVRSGQSATLSGRAASVVNERLWDDWTGGLAVPGPQEAAAEGVGEIYARLPDALGEARWPLLIRNLDVRVTIRRDLAITEVDQVFFNPASDTVEGLYRVRVPHGALLQRFAVDRDGQLAESVVKEQQVARRTYQQQVYRGSTEDPALLEWEAADQYRARIYPIAPGASRRIVIRYAEWIGSDNEQRTYRYAIGRGPRVQELSIDVDLAEAGAKTVRAGLGARKVGDRVVLYQSDFQPHADFYLDLVGVAPALGSASAYRAQHHAPAGPANADTDESDYFFAQIFPSPAETAPLTALDLVLLVDLSAGTDTTRLELGRSVVESLLSYLDERDRVSVVAADLGMHAIGDRATRLTAATAAQKEEILQALAREPAGGATDLGAALSGAAALLDRQRPGAIIYIGDAIPTVGELDLPELGKRLERLPRPPRLYGVAVGSEARLDLLDGLCRNAGLAVRVESKKDAAERAMQILEHASRPVLTDLSIDLGSGVDRVYPRRAAARVRGEPLTVIGRIRDKPPSEIVVKGRSDGLPFEQRLRLQVNDIEDASDLRLRWASERLQQILAEGGGREAIVEVGTRYGLVTPFTSFYVPSRSDLDSDPELRRMLDIRSEEERRGGWRSAAPRPASGYAFGCGLERQSSPGSAGPIGSVSSTTESAPPQAAREQLRSEEARPALAEPTLVNPGHTTVVPSTPSPTAFDQRQAGRVGHLAEQQNIGSSLPSQAPPADIDIDAVMGSGEGGGGVAALGSGDLRGGGAAQDAASLRPAPSAAPAPRPEPGSDGELNRKNVHHRRIRTSNDVLGALGGEERALADVLGQRDTGSDDGLGDDLAGNGLSPADEEAEPEMAVAIVGIVAHSARRCSNASRQSLGDRTALWRERLASRPGLEGAMGVFRQARRSCELPGWRDRRALLALMLGGASSAQDKVELWNAFRGDWGIQSFLRREILSRVRTADELRVVHEGLGDHGGVDWAAVEILLSRAQTPAARVGVARDLLRRWPDDLRLSIKLFALFEELGELREARRLADVIRSDPYADAQARTLVGEFFMRRREEAAAKRTFSEIVEFAPFDPYARRWLGDLYRAYGWYEDAYRQYETLASLTPDDDGVLLLLAAAAAGAGRTDEALRLESRVASSAEPGTREGNARWATLLSAMRFATLRLAARGDEAKLSKLVLRANRSGTLREAGQFRAILYWSHPDAGIELWTSYPQSEQSRPWELGSQFGIESWNVAELPAGSRLEVRRADDLGPRTVKAELLLIWKEGQVDERIERLELTFDRGHRVFAFAVDRAGQRPSTPEWSPAQVQR